MSNYSRGANFERRVMKHLQKQGWCVWRSAGSHSPADLIAGRKGEWLLVQCKIDGRFPPAERDALRILADELQCQISLARRSGKKLILTHAVKSELFKEINND